jgi:hypothetical protein
LSSFRSCDSGAKIDSVSFLTGMYILGTFREQRERACSRYYVQIYTEEDEKEVDKVRGERREMSEPDAAICLE